MDRELIELIRRMWQANPTWGSPRIRAELAKLGLQVSAATSAALKFASFRAIVACNRRDRKRMGEVTPSVA
jgi:hypothetical protein